MSRASKAHFVEFRFRFYHFGSDKPDNVDEIGQPVDDDSNVDSYLLKDDQQNQNDYDFNDDCCAEKNLTNDFDFIMPSAMPEQDVKEEAPLPPKQETEDEGIKKIKPKRETFPQILPESPPDAIDDPVVDLKRSDSALNIFDQTTILKLFSTRNWTETFFNRIFRKKFLVLSPGDDALVAFKNGFSLEEQMMHFSQNYPRDFLPAITSERDKKLTNGLWSFSVFSINLFPLFFCACKGRG